jgi:hypothetical protein
VAGARRYQGPPAGHPANHDHHLQLDSLYRLTSATYTGAISATFFYQYDAVGNMRAYTETVGITASTRVIRTFSTSYLHPNIHAVSYSGRPPFALSYPLSFCLLPLATAASPKAAFHVGSNRPGLPSSPS